MKKKIEKLIDVKSIVTILLVVTMIFLVVYSAITGKNITGDLFLLFSNIITMVVTYFFTKKSTGDEAKETSEESK